MDDLLTDALRQLLQDRCTPQVVRDIEAGDSSEPLWRLLEESGFADALVPEDEGGAGLSLSQAFPLLELCGAYAVPVPLAETMLARAVLAEAGVARPAGSIAFGQASADSDGRLSCALVPGGRVADWVLAAHGDAVPVAAGRRGRSRSPGVFSAWTRRLSWPRLSGPPRKRWPARTTCRCCTPAPAPRSWPVR